MRLTTRILDSRDLDDPSTAQLVAEIDPSGSSRRHRKGWEQAVTLQAMDVAGVLDRGGTCLSVAAGHELLLYHLTSRFAQVVASDLYADAGSWAADEGDLSMLVDPDRFAPGPYDRRRLLTCHLDGTDLRFPDAWFDATYSLSSIEHVGGEPGARAMLSEMARVTKPGGAVVLTTEVLVDGGPAWSVPALTLFTPEDLLALAAHEPRLELLDEAPDLRPPTEVEEVVPVADVSRLRLSGLEVASQLVMATPDGRAFTSACLSYRRVG